jgi:hypothetical protein
MQGNFLNGDPTIFDEKYKKLFFSKSSVTVDLSKKNIEDKVQKR